MEAHFSSFVLLSSVLLLSLAVHTKSDVIALTTDTFSDKVKEKGTAWFVKFCVPWCKHCKNLGSRWEDLGKAMEGEDEIEIGEVDCTTSKPVCTQVDIHSYPTFKLFYEGEEVAKYQDEIRDIIILRYRRGMDDHDLMSLKMTIINCEFPVGATGTRDLESLRNFVLEEAEKAAAKAQLDDEKEL